MLYRDKNNTLILPNEKVIYRDNGELVEKPISSEGRSWWLGCQKVHKHITDVTFTNITYTENQLARYEEVKNMIDVNESILTDYILENKFPTDEEYINGNSNIRLFQKEKEYIENINNLGHELIVEKLGNIEKSIIISNLGSELVQIKLQLAGGAL